MVEARVSLHLQKGMGRPRVRGRPIFSPKREWRLSLGSESWDPLPETSQEKNQASGQDPGEKDGSKVQEFQILGGSTVFPSAWLFRCQKDRKPIVLGLSQ